MTACFLVLSDSVSAAGHPAPAAQGSSRDDVTLIMVGDMLMHMPVVKSGFRPDGSRNYDHLFAQVREEIAGADLAIVNQETILGGEELGFSGYPTFNSPVEVGDAEAAAGFDVILQGTNHALDRSARGIENCLAFWETKHPQIQVLGIHDSAEDQNELCVVRCGAFRIAILNYTYGTNGLQMPAGKGYLVDYLSEKRVRDDIARAESSADLTVVCPHWGTEYRLTADNAQKKWALIFLECGVDLVIGTHPHVIEPIELYTDEEGRQMPVYYSLGNFVNATAAYGKGIMNRAVGGMARVTIGRGADGGACVKRADVLPLICHDVADGMTVYFLDDYTEELAEENRFAKRDPNFSLASCRDLADRIWPGLTAQEVRETPVQDRNHADNP